MKLKDPWKQVGRVARRALLVRLDSIFGNELFSN